MGDIFPLQSTVDPGGLDPPVEDGGATDAPVSTRQPLPGVSWEAVLVAASGDVLTPFADLVGQAQRLGFPLQTDDPSKTCRGAARGDSDLVPVAELDRSAPPARIRCYGSYSVERTSPPPDFAMQSRTDLTVTADAGLDLVGQATLSHLSITFTVTGDGSGEPFGEFVTLRPEDIPTDVFPVVVQPVPLPVQGQNVAPAVPDASMINLQIPSGTRAAMNTGPGCPSFGWSQVLISRDGREAFADLMNQSIEQGFTESDSDVVEGSLLGRDFLYFGGYNQDIGAGVAIFLAQGGENPEDAILVNFCGER